MAHCSPAVYDTTYKNDFCGSNGSPRTTLLYGDRVGSHWFPKDYTDGRFGNWHNTPGVGPHSHPPINGCCPRPYSDFGYQTAYKDFYGYVDSKWPMFSRHRYGETCGITDKSLIDRQFTDRSRNATYYSYPNGGYCVKQPVYVPPYRRTKACCKSCEAK